MVSKVGLKLGLIGSVLSLVNGFFIIFFPSVSIMTIITIMVIGILGLVGIVLGFEGKKKVGGILLIIAGIVSSSYVGFLGLFYIESTLMVLSGLFILTIEDKRESPEHIIKLKIKINYLFIGGSLIAGISFLIMWLTSLLITMYLAIPVYIFALLLITLSFHLIGNKRVWLDIPIVLIISNVFILPTMTISGTPPDFDYRWVWILVYLLNYGVLLILCILLVRKKNKADSLLLDEVPILLLIIDESGTTYFNHSFIPNWDYNDLLGSFMSALNMVSGEIFSKSIERIRIGENLILINPLDPFLVCYVIKGPSFFALGKLKNFSDVIRYSSEIWEALQRSIRTSEILDLNNPPSLGAAVNEIFNKSI